MTPEINEMQLTIEHLTKVNNELTAWKQEYNSSKQSFKRLSVRLRKLCKRLKPDTETVIEMQKLAKEISDLARKVDS